LTSAVYRGDGFTLSPLYPEPIDYEVGWIDLDAVEKKQTP
jgi:hypothetical protein